MHQVTNFINKFSFSRKLAFTFFICALVTFIVIDAIMNVLYSTVVTSTNSDSIFDTQAFSQFSNSQILSSTQSYIQSGVDIYEQIITQTFTTYLHFTQNPGLYTTKQKKGVNPKLCSEYTTARYDVSCIYFYTQNSTFYNEPFIDKVLASSATSHYPKMLKRINVIYQSLSDPTDISIRTMPATQDFIVPNTKTITDRMNDLQAGTVITSDWYYDTLSNTKNTTKLISLRLLVPNTDNYNMLIQAQVNQMLLDGALSNIYSYPSSKTLLIKTYNNNTKYSILGQVMPLPQSIDLHNYLIDGQKNININGYDFLVTTRTLIDTNNDIYNDTMLLSAPQSDISTSQNKLIIFLNTTETRLPNIVYSQFLQKQYSVLIYILYGWTFIVMLVVISIGVVIGDIIFSYFSLIRKKCKQYLENPQQIKQIKSQVRDTVRNEKNNIQLYQNIVSIMDGIQNKKKQNRKNYRIGYDQYPLNRLGMSFQNRMKINDYHKFQQIGNLIRDRTLEN